MMIGVLALQGDFREHCAMVERCGAEAAEVRLPEDMRAVEGLIIPGGESTTVGKLMRRYGLDEAIVARAARGMPLFGTCMGLIMMAREVEGSDQPLLGVMDVSVRRNAFGRQVDSFECAVEVPFLGLPEVPGVFIRAPYISRAGRGVEVLARVDGRIVLARQQNMLGAAFHPELTDDLRIHRIFLDMAASHPVELKAAS